MAGPLSTDLLSDVPAAKVAGQRRMLALDGGGIRGVLTLEVLKHIEDMVKAEQGDEATLSDYFDYFAGTSTGALIATWLALGRTVDDLMAIYVGDGDKIFQEVSLLRRVGSRFQYRYAADQLADYLQGELGADTPFGSASFKSLLLVVLHNVTTDSPWPLSNNPKAKYNAADRDDNNMLLPLWRVLRGSTAAPTFFPPETVQLGVGPREFVFVDGGVTPYNNPAFQLYLSATQPTYRLGWASGAHKLLLVSIGTGRAPNTAHDRDGEDMTIFYTAKNLPKTFMNGAAYQQDLACRVAGHCVAGDPIDREIGDLHGTDPTGKAFTYARFDATLTAPGLTALGLETMTEPDRLARLGKMDDLDNIDDLRLIGRRVARTVSPDIFAGFPGIRG